VNGVDPLGLCWPSWACGPEHAIGGAATTTWNGVKSFATGLVGTPRGCGTNGAAYDAGNVTWWAAAIGGLFGGGATGGNGGDDEVIAGEGGLPDLEASQSQLEAKFNHAGDFGVTESRGASGFQAYGKALDSFVNDPATVRVMGTYRGSPAILNYNPTTAQVVIQSPGGSLISGWQMSPAQLQNVVSRGSLGGG
jgi:hypothetical protein